MTKTQKILITGANGLLGFHLTRVMSEKYSILATDIQDHSFTSGFNYRPLDISCREDIFTVCSDFKPDIILNAAAYTNVDDCETNVETAFLVNARGPLFLAEWCLQNRAKLIHISTDYIFNGQNGPYKETDTPDPVSVYGLTKLAGEAQIRRLLSNYLIVRTNVLFGKGPTEKASFVRWVVDSLRAQRLIHIVDDQYNNPTWSDDLASAVRVLLEINLTGVINYGGLDYMNRYEFARLICRVFDLDTGLINPVSTERLALAAPRPLKGGLDISRIKTIPGIPLTPLEKILTIIKETGY